MPAMLSVLPKLVAQALSGSAPAVAGVAVGVAEARRGGVGGLGRARRFRAGVDRVAIVVDGLARRRGARARPDDVRRVRARGDVDVVADELLRQVVVARPV